MPVGVIHRDAQSAPFFDGTARGELLLRSCNECQHLMEPAAMTCSRCGSRHFCWKAAAGDGTILTWTVVHTRGRDGAAPVRIPVAIVELREGPWFEAQLIDVDPDDITVGMRLRVDFARPEGGEALPVFAPSS